MGLNPWAKAFEPRSQAGGHGPKAEGDKKNALEVFELGALPSEVITSIASFLRAPRDAIRFASACKSTRQHVAEAALQLDLRAAALTAGHADGREAPACKAQILRGLQKYMPGTVALLLPNALHEDDDFRQLLAALPRLQLLDVSGGRKLTHTSAQTLARANGSAVAANRRLTAFIPAAPASQSPNTPVPVVPAPEGPHSPGRTGRDPGPGGARGRVVPLRVVNLQRCYQLHGGSLDELLGSPGIACLALSHLDLGGWPAGRAARGAAAEPEDAAARPPSSLQVLALHNCLRLHGAVITALAAAGTGALPPAAAAAAAAAPAGCAPDAGCCALPGPPFPAAAAAAAAAPPSGVRFLLLGGSTLAIASFFGAASSGVASLYGAGVVDPPPPLPPRAEELLAGSYTPWRTSTSTTVQAHLVAARFLVAAVLRMPQLVALELSFFPPPLVACVRRVLGDAAATGRAAPVEVWDFAVDVADVEAARRSLRRALRVSAAPAAAPPGGPAAAAAGGGPRASLGGGCPGGGGGFGADALDELAAATVLRCAVNCSSVTRSTPLHVAAERGNARGVGTLLAAGAAVDARDTGGSTPLFLAAEAGHAGAVEALLGAGADVRQSNAAGESPLYICALRGHLACVQALISHCTARGLAWQHPGLYGDAWTPLHAAAVANRADVAACLLQAAGSSGAGELVVAPNKYGQSVVHVAARKGSAQLLRLLLGAGGAGVVGSRDGNGDTPVDVAKKNRHVAALAEFRRMAGGAAVAAQQSAATAMA